MSLNKYNSQYENIMKESLSTVDRDKKLADLMTVLEKEYKIPSLRNIEFEKNNRAIIALYRKISLSRNI
ncbi:hypothetical protein [Longirhabdus pacifica]|uniref:hypothetical protein n=1 Tax=Longirhabdus pacifica TaxID=2305227 RepID=UPI001008DD68|nr:hypothetical protein [Longirhabdus pacifica]